MKQVEIEAQIEAIKSILAELSVPFEIKSFTWADGWVQTSGLYTDATFDSISFRNNDFGVNMNQYGRLRLSNYTEKEFYHVSDTSVETLKEDVQKLLMKNALK